ncbi:MAG: TonB family protein [Candidatus Aminicenantes bacterium]|nr:TonB family protein [Candidatus Aminicenantes bacterium]
MTASGERFLFKRAVYISLGAHLAFLLLIVVSPHLPRPSRKGLIHYIPLDMVVGGGGGGRGGGGGGPAAKGQVPPAKKETLRDLTTPQKAQMVEKPTMRHPVEKPKREPQAKIEKKAAITKPEPSTPDMAAREGTPEGVEGGSGLGTGLRIGGGPGGGFGPGGAGFGPGGGLANFPYAYYLNIITDRVSSNWFSSLVDPGVSGSFQTIVYFRIEKSGQITDVKIEQSSGVTPLDLSAVRAVRASAPFPPLPREYGETYLGIHLIFEHTK